MIIINLYEIIINLLALGIALVLVPVGLLIWFLIGTNLYKLIKDYYGKENKQEI
tara:strand:- start:2528 stop:2689 length:162 start_codon:yes stop_codon:yes gene_type:complete